MLWRRQNFFTGEGSTNGAVSIQVIPKTCIGGKQRWSPRGRPWPRGQILKSLASRPQVLENWPVLGSRTARFYGMLKFCGALEKFFGKRFLVEIA